VSARSGIVVEVQEGRPPDPQAWDDLARASGNIVQSTVFDPAEVFFGMRPVYFAAHDDGRLCGGVKLYASANRKLAPITRPLTLGFTQLGEILVAEGAPAAAVGQALSDAVERHLVSSGAVTLRVSGLYGGLDGLIAPSAAAHAVAQFNVAAVDLSDGGALWDRLHSSHRAKIRKAERNGIAFVREDSIERLITLMDETYRGQSHSGPDREYVRHAYAALKNQGADLFFAVQGSDYLAGEMCLAWGKVAYYQFGGTARVNVGAGAYLHWQVMNHYKERGMARYVLGQVAVEDDPANPKFVVGISRFKRHFGPEEVPSASRFYILRQRRHQIWTRLSGWARRVRRLATWTTPR
jgi:hypothetical protein